MAKILSEVQDSCSAVCATRDGHMIYSVNDMLVGRSLEKYGEYSQAKVNLLQQICQPGSVVVEVGAYNGAITLALSKATGEQGRVIAYEACHTFFQQLCGSLALNGITNTETINAIVGAENGKQIMLDPVMNPESLQNLASFNCEHWNNLDESSGGHYVDVVALDEVLDVPYLHLLKVSAKAMEPDVVKGATETLRKMRPMLHFDCETPDTTQALIEALWELEYETYWNVSMLFNPENFNNDSENFLVNDQGGVLGHVCMLGVPKERQMTIQGMDVITDSSSHPYKQ